jgi:ankyrin repeat protein
VKSLIESVFRNDLAELQSTLAQNVIVDERDNDARTPLIHAGIDNKLDAAKLLLASGASVDAQDKLGNSALHYAAQNYHLEMASLLIANHATVDIQDIHGNTPLWRAVFNSRGRGDLIAILLNAGAEKNHRNKTGKTPLALAKTISNYDIGRFFD